MFSSFSNPRRLSMTESNCSNLLTLSAVEKMEVMDKVEQLNGDIETAIRQLAEQKREIIRKEESSQT